MSFIVEIASVPDRDDVVAEIWWDGDMVAEMRRVTDGRLMLDIYTNESREPWSFELQSWLSALTEAQRRLG